MQTVCLGNFYDIHDGVLVEITLGRGRAANVVGLARLGEVGRVFISVRIDGNGFHAHAVQGTDDACGGSAAICNDDFLEHRRNFRLEGGGPVAELVLGDAARTIPAVNFEQPDDHVAGFARVDDEL